MEKINLADILSNICIPLIIGWITFIIAKRQIRGSGVTQFRQQWINDLRESISLFITKAELISMLDLDDDETYFDCFEELSQTQNKIELMLNPEEDDHNEVIAILDNMRELAHDEKLREDKLEARMNKEIEKLLAVSKRVLKREWNVVKKGR